MLNKKYKKQEISKQLTKVKAGLRAPGKFLYMNDFSATKGMRKKEEKRVKSRKKLEKELRWAGKMLQRAEKIVKVVMNFSQ